MLTQNLSQKKTIDILKNRSLNKYSIEAGFYCKILFSSLLFGINLSIVY